MPSAYLISLLGTLLRSNEMECDSNHRNRLSRSGNFTFHSQVRVLIIVTAMGVLMCCRVDVNVTGKCIIFVTYFLFFRIS